MNIERFARQLFNQWGIGHPEVGGVSRNRGILLIVSQGDRTARIELGADWGRAFDRTCQRIMDEQIVFHFRRGRFQEGILAGVNALEQMARGEPLPAAPRPWWHYALVVAAIGLGGFTSISLVLQGVGGWAWLFWAAVLSALGMILMTILMILVSNRRSSLGGGFGGGFGGGSFGGGFSGGGGATGSW